MAPAIVTEKDVLALWNRMNEKRSRIPVARPKFRVGQHVRISKETMKFAKGGSKIRRPRYSELCHTQDPVTRIRTRRFE